MAKRFFCLFMNILAESQPNFWSALPTILWVGLIVVVLYILRKSLFELVAHLITRVRAGAPVRFGSLEVGALRTEQHRVPTPIGESSSGSESTHYPLHAATPLSQAAIELTEVRREHYEDTRRIMLVHRLFVSSRPNQVYDVLIYLTPQYGGSLVEVTSVEYFFGRYWANKVFESYDRSRGFPILTSAYGTFLCNARVSFNDGKKQDLFRYIDFEMGAYAPVLINNDDMPKKTVEGKSES